MTLYINEYGFNISFPTNFDLNGPGATTLQKVTLTIRRPKASPIHKTYLKAQLDAMPIRKLVWGVLENDLSQSGNYTVQAECLYGPTSVSRDTRRVSSHYRFEVKAPEVGFPALV